MHSLFVIGTELFLPHHSGNFVSFNIRNVGDCSFLQIKKSPTALIGLIIDSECQLISLQNPSRKWRNRWHAGFHLKQLEFIRRICLARHTSKEIFVFSIDSESSVISGVDQRCQDFVMIQKSMTELSFCVIEGILRAFQIVDSVVLRMVKFFRNREPRDVGNFFTELHVKYLPIKNKRIVT